MLKLQKPSTKEIALQAGNALAELLSNIPMLEVQRIEYCEEQIDFVVRVRAREGGQQYIIGCEVKTSGQPRYAETALLRLAAWRSNLKEPTFPIFAAPYISPAVRSICADWDFGYLDLSGNCLLKFGPVYIERTVAAAPPTEQRELKSIYKPKSARVLRVLLNDPYREWKVKDLAEASRVSIGHISNVRNALRDRRWLAPVAGTLLSKPGELLDEWRDNYEVEGETLNFYTTLHGSSMHKAILGTLNVETDHGPTAILSSYSAADWIAPYGRTGKTYFYANAAGLQKLTDGLSLRPVNTGENVKITIPKDDGVFLAPEVPTLGITCTSIIQTYLDLYVSGERGREAAEHLRTEKIQW